MKKYIFTVLILTAFALQGCNDKEDVGIGKGEIHHNGNIYSLNSARKITPHIASSPSHITGIVYYYWKPLIINRASWNTCATIIVNSENNKLQSGEFHLRWLNVTHRDNCIRMEMHLVDDFVWFSTRVNPAETKIKLTITEDRNGIFDIELRQADGKGDFFITYRGLVPETFN